MKKLKMMADSRGTLEVFKGNRQLDDDDLSDEEMEARREDHRKQCKT